MFIVKECQLLNNVNPFKRWRNGLYYCHSIPKNEFYNKEESANAARRKSKKLIIKEKPVKKTTSRIQLERAFNKYLFGPLVETKKEKYQRLKEDGPQSLTLKKKPKKWYSYNKVDYERFASIYAGSGVLQLSTKLPSNSSKSASVKDSELRSKVSHDDYYSKSSLHQKNEIIVPEINCYLQESTKEINKSFKKEELLTPIYNPIYFDAPCLVDIDSCLTFPLFYETERLLCGNKSIFVSKFEGDGSVSNTGDEDGKERHNMMKKVPSVSHILSSTMSDASKAALEKWEKQMTEKLGEEGFKAYKQELFSQGTLLHHCIHTQLEMHQPPSPKQEEQLKGLWTSVKNVVLEVEQADKVHLLESPVTHPHLHYSGIIDCVAVYRDTPVVIEWKTSSKVKRTLRSTYDNPLQVAAYLGAMQFDPAFHHLREVQSGLIVLSYNNGEVGDTHLLTPAQLKFYWRKWLSRLATFWMQQELDPSLHK